MLYSYLPYGIFLRLFGDRKKYGLKEDPDDKEYQAWIKGSLNFYRETQKKGVGLRVNHLGYEISSKLDLTDKIVLETGPGRIEHLDYNTTRPKKYMIADIREEFLFEAEEQLKHYGILNYEKYIYDGIHLPLSNQTVDILFTFHQLEHIYDLEEFVLEVKRILKPKGMLVGAVPCEGGLAWGLGRFLTTRRYHKTKTSYNYDKIICWAHPNFVDKIKTILDKHFLCRMSLKKPFSFFPLDLNLSWLFIYQHSEYE